MTITTTRLLQFSQQFSKFYTQKFSPLLEQSQLSMREMHVLLFLGNNPDYDTARDIAEFRGLSKSQVSQAVELLAAEGLLARTPDQSDRRVVHLSITPEAMPLVKAAQALPAECSEQLLVGLTQEQRQQLHILLETVLDNGARLAEELIP